MYDVTETCADGVAQVFPADGKTFDPAMYIGVALEQGTGATVAVEFDYGFGYVDSTAVTTKKTFLADGCKKIRITATGADCDARVTAFSPIGGL